MKKLNKLQINPEKLMKSEELVTLRGGDEGGYGSNNGSGGGNGSGTMALNCFYSFIRLGCVYTCCGITQSDAMAICRTQYPSTTNVVYQCGYNCGMWI
jgi:hypothetical protein